MELSHNTCPRCGDKPAATRGNNRCWYCDQPIPNHHIYLSTGCLHDQHDYCRSDTGHTTHSHTGHTLTEYTWPKQPGQCKWCDALCTCNCHA